MSWWTLPPESATVPVICSLNGFGPKQCAMYRVGLPASFPRASTMSDNQRPLASAQAIAEVMAQIGHIAESLGYSQGLKPAQWTALRYFANANDSRRTVSAFADFHATTRGAASQMVEVLVKKGYLERVPVPGDRRTVRIEPTPAALDILKSDPVEEVTRVIAQLSAEEQFRLAESLTKIMRGLMAHRLG